MTDAIVYKRKFTTEENMVFTSSGLGTDPNDLNNNITCRHQKTRCCVRLLNLLLGSGVLKAVIENYEV